MDMKYIYTYSSILFLAILFSGCIQYREVQIVKITEIGIKEISVKGIEVEVAMQIKNPNKYDISIVDSDLAISLKGEKMGVASIKEKIKLKKKSNKIYRFTIQSHFKDIASGALPILMGLITKNSMALRVQGNIKAKAKGISKKIPIDFKENIKL